MNAAEEKLALVLPADAAGLRFDQALARLLPQHSRASLQLWIRAERVQVEGRLPRASEKVRGGERVEILIPQTPAGDWAAEAIPLDIVYEDDDLLVINKPAGLVVHPGAGNPEGTMLNALLHHAPTLNKLARAGIVHRLDKETSGLLVVAKTEHTRLDLIEQLKERTLKREYLALVQGLLVAGGTVDAPIGRHSQVRTRMAVSEGGRPAVSHYRIEKKYRAHTLLRVKLESGRTHQIRVHMAHLKHPLVGDPVYGGRLNLPKGASPALIAALQGFKRQALHAARLGLVHPVTGKNVEWEAPMPDDMRALLKVLEKDAKG
ncbi:MAG TPA: 23S rRNA pseudouridine(1911/1915/1917) synthase RluD [Acidiferrobacterales bacterium]|nr:23S rRNA pseudouridine(1911/1915/1917) synthase RluD [Acidiferrobacterales bacterium]